MIKTLIFVLKRNVLFDQIENTQKINHFKKMWLSNSWDTEDRDVIWDWFSTFITLSQKYIKNKRTD